MNILTPTQQHLDFSWAVSARSATKRSGPRAIALGVFATTLATCALLFIAKTPATSEPGTGNKTATRGSA